MLALAHVLSFCLPAAVELGMVSTGTAQAVHNFGCAYVYMW